MTTDPALFLTPSEVCERWRIDIRTLDKLDLGWFWVSPRVRRIRREDVISYEKAQRLALEYTESTIVGSAR